MTPSALLLVIALGADAPDPVPACRLAREGELLKQVRETVRRVLAADLVLAGCGMTCSGLDGRRSALIEVCSRVEPVFGSAAVNGVAVTGDSRGSSLALSVVEDVPVAPCATEGGTDTSTLRSICLTFPNEEVRCSAEALRGLFKADPSGLAAFFVIAHEVRHVAVNRGRGAQRAWDGAVSVDCRKTRQGKIEDLKLGACKGSVDQRAEESDADAWATRAWSVTPELNGPFGAAVLAQSLPGYGTATSRTPASRPWCADAPEGAEEGALLQLAGDMPIPTRARADDVIFGAEDDISFDPNWPQAIAHGCTAEIGGLELAQRLETTLTGWSDRLKSTSLAARGRDAVLEDVFCHCSESSRFPVRGTHPDPASRLASLLSLVAFISMQERALRVDHEVLDFSSSFGTLAAPTPLELEDDSLWGRFARGAKALGLTIVKPGEQSDTLGLRFGSPSRPATPPAPRAVTGPPPKWKKVSLAYCRSDRRFFALSNQLASRLAALSAEGSRQQAFAETLCDSLVDVENESAAPCRPDEQ